MMHGKFLSVLSIVVLLTLLFSSFLYADPLKVQSVTISGKGEGDKAVITDGRWLDEGASWDEVGTFSWTGRATNIVFDFGKLVNLEHVIFQVDDNDDYQLEVSADGATYAKWLLFTADAGEVEAGLDMVATKNDHPEYINGLNPEPVKARYVRLKAIEGDDAYSLAEIEFHGSAVPEVIPEKETTEIVPPPIPSVPSTPPAVVAEVSKKEEVPVVHKRLTSIKVTVVGDVTNSPSLLTDGVMVEPETAWDSEQCVVWNDPSVLFTFDLGGPSVISSASLQVDNNDDYTLEYSTDNRQFTKLLTVTAAMGTIEAGIDTFSSDPKAASHVAELKFAPVTARYVRLMAREGDDAYSAAEVTFIGHPVVTE